VWAEDSFYSVEIYSLTPRFNAVAVGSAVEKNRLKRFFSQLARPTRLKPGVNGNIFRRANPSRSGVFHLRFLAIFIRKLAFIFDWLPDILRHQQLPSG
jgi:hypothetical protein